MSCECTDPATRSCPECREHEADARSQRYAERVSRSGLPHGLRDLSLVQAPVSPASDAAHQWAEGEIRGLCLTGPVGVGKTWLAAAAAWQRLQRYSVRWVSVAQMMSQLRSGFGTELKAQADRVITGTGAVVLDDLDKVNPTDFGKEVLFSAIDGRVEEGSPLLVTTNKSLSELDSMLGTPIASRLAGYCRTVRMVGEDRRLA